ncbi:MAG: hypothetical protein ACYCX6_09685, partial [Vulcanimicrobiaceae bacterium]
MIVLLVLAFIPVAFWAMAGVTSQARVMHGEIMRGELAYAKVASDADTLRSASLDAATNPSPASAQSSLQIAKAMLAKFPADVRKMELLIGKDKAISSLVHSFRATSSNYDFQSLAGVGLLAQGKTAQAL